MAPSAKRQHLINTAMRLFYTEGFNATGIDKIITEAGVARMTLYKHFKSKNDLILAVLQKRDEEFTDWFKKAVDASARRPRDKLLTMFDVLEDWFTGKAFPEMGFAGCAFINACAEFSDTNNPAHRMAAEHKRQLLNHVSNIARQARARDPEGLARDLMLLKEGAIVTMQVSGDTNAARHAKSIAERILAVYFPDEHTEDERVPVDA